MKCLEDYGSVSGPLVRRLRMRKKKESIKGRLGIQNEGGAGTYLKLGECFSGSKKGMLAYIRDGIKSKLQGWLFAKSLSQGGKGNIDKIICHGLCYVMSQVTKRNMYKVD